MHLRDLFVRHAVTGQNPQFLIGRQDLIKDLAERLAEDRQTSGVIFGTRGVGKTSIAWQVATILSGTNVRFKRKEMLGPGAPPKFLTVFHKCSRHVDTVGDVLLELLLTKSSDFSVDKVLGPYLGDGEDVQSITRRITGGIPKIFEVSEESKSETHSPLREARKLISSESDKIALFNEVVYLASKNTGDQRILFVVDEFDRPRDYAAGVKLPDGQKKDIEGVGEMIKDNDHAQFLFVGIAESVAEILKDHKSAGRKMPGTVKQAPLLDDAEIEEIFTRAEKVSGNQLRVSREFLDQVIRYSSGLPWIAQHVGYEAVRKSEGPLELAHAAFAPALKATVDSYAEDADMQDSVEYLESANRTDLEIMGVIWDHPRGEEELEVRKAVGQRWRQNFDAALRRLIAKQMLVRKSGSRLAFKDPIVRVFARKYIDDARAP